MNSAVRQLEPTTLWNHFADLNAVPRPSKKEQRVIQFIKMFGEALKLPTTVDAIGNVIIKKPATSSMEHKETVVLQSHLDMVHQKNADTHFDFETQGIEMYIDGDWVKAKGTTLGADNGIGVATIMALLSSKDIPHPALEALFTIDEETGMTGALAFEGGLLDGNIMLNLDTEEDNELTIGCAGGIDVTAKGTYPSVKPTNTAAFRLKIKGLTGGHSGMDIHKGRGNANKLMNRCLFNLVQDAHIEVASIEGGSLRNAIPRESVADIVVSENNIEQVKQSIEQFQSILQAEYATTDSNIIISIETIGTPTQVISTDFLNKFLRTIYTCQNGIYRMSPDIAGLVQTSNNVARVVVKDGHYEILCLTRSSVDSEKTDLQMSLTSAFVLLGAEVTYGGA